MSTGGASKVTMGAVAQHAGVSIATVSRALRGLPSVAPETRVHIERSAAELGYVGLPWTGDGGGMIAVIVPSINAWYSAVALEGAEEVFRAAGCDVVLVSLGHGSVDRRQFTRSLLHSRVDACLVIAVDLTDQEAEQLQALTVPCIGVGVAHPVLPRVEIDEIAAAELATQHLLNLGHRRIAYIGSGLEAQPASTAFSLRADGWASALRSAGLQPNPALRVEGGDTAASARAAITSLLTSANRPTAVFAASDELGFGVIWAVRDLGLRVPDDVSVIGVDDHEHAELLDLSTVRHQPLQQGRTAASLLVAQLNTTEFVLNRVDAPVELVPRGSTTARQHGSTTRRDAVRPIRAGRWM